MLQIIVTRSTSPLYRVWSLFLELSRKSLETYVRKREKRGGDIFPNLWTFHAKVSGDSCLRLNSRHASRRINPGQKGRGRGKVRTERALQLQLHYPWRLSSSINKTEIPPKAWWGHVHDVRNFFRIFVFHTPMPAFGRDRHNIIHATSLTSSSFGLTPLLPP